MLSINIPVFNVDVNELVLQLVHQAEKLPVSFEIRVYDDGSAENVKIANRSIQKYPNVVYIELEKNIGRAAIRNKMGLESEYEYLLFIDADSRMVKNNYLHVYVAQKKPNMVLCGGTAYQREKPAEREKILRWTYGTEREAVSAEVRNSKKGFIITSNNFLISKPVFERIHFREDIRDYGHEDTVLGFDLFKNEIEIRHVENPVEHVGLEDAEVFIQKSKTALENLKYISEVILKKDEDFVRQVNFLEHYYSITKWFPVVGLRLFYFLFHGICERNLKGKKPRILWFDVYKLCFFAGIKKP